MAVLNIENVSKTFGETRVLEDINISMAEGEFLILVGPSGCGKSTLLNMIAGLESVSDGRITLDGRSVNDASPRERNIAMVFQFYALYPNMNVRRNIEFGLKMRGVPKAERAQTVERVARMLQIENLLDRKPAQLSGGQRQRVAIGRALARDPALFLFDEPLSNLDAKLRVEMRTELKQLHQRLGTAMVYVTHDQIEAMTLGDRIAVMHAGRVQQLGTPREIYDDPANRYVAGFIGSPAMNFIECGLTGSGGDTAVRLTGSDTETHLALPQATAAKLAEHGKTRVLMGVRPEHLVPAAEADTRRARVTCAIDVVEPTGPDTYLHTELNDAAVTARCLPSAAPNTGAHIPLAIDAERAVFFDCDTEQRIA
ncbi:ABC transporter ATP-binding protein [Salinisphaera sp. Q1T1-3]|uniref:ABC transporter ATP-binding protein n=1 Tax=Salinisphaera sp. Q1T1-3 TaxID=2321229 RepID=UPI000E766CA8|nr:sn-glycerol-3-phosphate ABC transporter ATP-binding protein UgpC [Salinisphaera sp. Q1T1-3]RJS93101.1 sn-glycerol-3-phosphate ABC transporter ATP-binding protein UgpC [Salinisphaera sp. Q1T1-3]